VLGDASLPSWFLSEGRKNIFVKRSMIVAAIRKFFAEKKFLEMETPLLWHVPDPNPNIQPFSTEYVSEGTSQEVFLSSSPEHAMKVLLCSGFKNIFQITKFFRNGETDEVHNPEFTGLEWYETGVDYHGIMKTCEELFAFVAKSVLGTTTITYQDKMIDLSAPWERITVREAFVKFAGIDIAECGNVDSFRAAAKAKEDLAVSDDDDWETIFFKAYLHYVERNLTGNKPVFLTEYPSKLSSLARKKASDSMVVERFEIFAGGMELGNAFSELGDPVEQEQRFVEDLRKKYPASKELPIDYTLINAMKHGLPRCGGIAVGLDRLVMLLLDCSSIRDVILFPQ